MDLMSSIHLREGSFGSHRLERLRCMRVLIKDIQGGLQWCSYGVYSAFGMLSSVTLNVPECHGFTGVIQ